MILRNACLAACTLLACGAAHCANLGFLGNAPISRMNEEDVNMMYATAQEALEHGGDGQRRGWENPSTGASGIMTPLDTYTGTDGIRCRHLQVISRAGGLKNQSVFELCRQPDGQWKAQNR